MSSLRRLLVVFLPALLFGVVHGDDCGGGISGILGANPDNVCCAEECDTCGGDGCSTREGGAVACCTGNIQEADVSCNKTGEGPCIVQELSGSSSPTPVMAMPDCGDATPEFTWDPDAGFNGHMTAVGDGCFTMTDLYNFLERQEDGIYVMNGEDEVIENPVEPTGRWLLKFNLYVTGGGTFNCIGTSQGGDCDVLRIHSEGSNAYHEIRGHGGNLYFEDTLVTSWHTSNEMVHEDHTEGRSFINCVSEKMVGSGTCAKNDMGECRMDIIDSEMGYLGWYDTESYGLTWKVRGFCSDLSNPEVFDDVDVFGDIMGSDIHHMYYGMYSYGHQGGVWTDNKMHDNIVYGFDPHDDSDYLTISGNEVYNNNNHGIIASKRCNNVEIFNNVVYDGGDDASGIFLHRSGNNCKVFGNEVYDMKNTGIVLHESFDCEVNENFIHDTVYGIRLVVGAGNNHVFDNEFESIKEAGLFTDTGSDVPEYGDGRPFNNRFYDNVMSDTTVPIKIKASDRTSIKFNTFDGAAEIEFNDAYATTWEGNTIPSTACMTNHYGSSSTFTGSPGLPLACE